MGSKYKGTEEEKQSLNSFIKLFRSYETVSKLVRENLSKQHLTISQFGVLESLYHLGPMCQNDLASKILKSGGNLTIVIDNLVKKKMLRRVKKPEDRRYYLIHLTKQGEELISNYFSEHVSFIQRIMSPLNMTEQKELEFLLRKLGKSN